MCLCCLSFEKRWCYAGCSVQQHQCNAYVSMAKHSLQTSHEIRQNGKYCIRQFALLTVNCWLTAVPAEGNGNLQTQICVLVARPRRCLTLSNPVPWQNWMAAYLSCWWRRCFVADQLWLMKRIREEEEDWLLRFCCYWFMSSSLIADWLIDWLIDW